MRYMQQEQQQQNKQQQLEQQVFSEVIALAVFDDGHSKARVTLHRSASQRKWLEQQRCMSVTSALARVRLEFATAVVLAISILWMLRHLEHPCYHACWTCHESFQLRQLANFWELLKTTLETKLLSTVNEGHALHVQTTPKGNVKTCYRETLRLNHV